ncbi:MAG: hypothetical protein K5872_08780 [Rhizobiaceae bacterium]|nr:hypothetical protein [Rhizobiaceae bacterium]MCV0406309.1 hypothetical protein [Rhizobiaceae bacterium]
MTWQDLKRDLIANAPLDLDIQPNPAFDPRNPSRAKRHNLQLSASRGGFRFRSLGYGMNKRAFLVEEPSGAQDWVLAVSSGLSSAKTDMEGEAQKLIDLGKADVPVPAPFNEANVGLRDILFELRVIDNDGNDSEQTCFLQQYLPFIEMDKINKSQPDFASNRILVSGKKPPMHNRTVGDLKKIKKELKRQEWGDFQVMYDSVSGGVYVFDPLPTNTSGESPLPWVKKWIEDIESAPT